MRFTVAPSSRAKRQIREQADYLRRERGVGLMIRWFAAVEVALRSLDKNPYGRPLCLDEAADGTGLREHYFGLGKTTTHRLVFRVRDDTVEVLLVWPTALGDFTAGDL